MLNLIETNDMNVEVKQLKDTQTGGVFVPLTHWDAIANKPEDIAKESTVVGKTQEIQNTLNAVNNNVTSSKDILNGRLGDIFTKFGDLTTFIAQKFDWLSGFIVTKKDELQQFIIERKNELHNFIATDVLGTINRNHGEILGKTNDVLGRQQNYENNAVLRAQDVLNTVNSQGSQLGKHLDVLITKIDEIELPEIDTADLAKQGDNPDATNSAIYDAINAISPDVVQGKERLATAITSKGVETTSADSLSQMAENVSSIAQESYTIDGGEMYAKQLYGSLETPNYWNMYEVLQNMLSDGRLSNYGGILLAEYIRGYDSIALEGAGTGGAYVVSDKNENGQFKIYTEDTTHIWTEEFDGKGNRWVAYCFANEWHDYNITNTDLSPRSIHIGRKVGTINGLVNGRASEVVVGDGNKLKSFNAPNQNWGKNIVLRNIVEQKSTGVIFGVSSAVESIYLSADSIDMPAESAHSGIIGETGVALNTYSIIVDCPNIISCNIIRANNGSKTGVNEIIIKGYYARLAMVSYNYNTNLNSLRKIKLLGIEDLKFNFRHDNAPQWPTSLSIYISYTDNDKTKSAIFSYNYRNGWTNTIDLEVKQGWNKPIVANCLESLTEQNMYNHLLCRLKQDEPMCGEGITITLGATNISKLTSEDSVALLDKLTNIYGYTFA